VVKRYSLRSMEILNFLNQLSKIFRFPILISNEEGFVFTPGIYIFLIRWGTLVYYLLGKRNIRNPSEEIRIEKFK